MTPEQRAELKRLAESATKGPWFVGHVHRKCTLDHGKGTGGHGGPHCRYEEFSRDYAYTAEGVSICAESGEHVLWGGYDGAEMSESDARFIAAANPAAVLDLLAEHEEMRRLLAYVQECDGGPKILDEAKALEWVRRDDIREDLAEAQAEVERLKAEIASMKHDAGTDILFGD